MRKSLAGDSGKTMIHAFVTIIAVSEVLYGMYSTPRHESYCARGMFDRIATDLRDQLRWLPVQQKRQYEVSALVYFAYIR